MNAPAPPPKLFREEAQTTAAQCPACGGPLDLRGFGGTSRVVCPYCGSESSPDEHGPLRLVEQARRARKASALPLYRRGTLEGDTWEILGIMWREVRDEGIAYPWQEFLLFNPYRGYRYLIFSMTDGHWTFAEALPGAPQVGSSLGGHRTARFKGRTYRHFQSAPAHVTYVEGEFPWQVRVGDTAQTHDYVYRDESLSVEETFTSGEQGSGADIAFTRARHLEGSRVWAAFQLDGRPPPTRGVGMCQPNPWMKRRGLTWASMGLLFLLWAVTATSYVAARSGRVVFSRGDVQLAQEVVADVEIGTSGPTTLQFDLSAPGLSNAWASAEALLVPQDSEDAISLAVTAEEWHGVTDGESWRDGDRTPSFVVGGVAPGHYQLSLQTTAGTTAGPAPSGLVLAVSLREDVVLWRYVFLPLAFIFGLPILYWIMGRIFEARRWQSSDYAGSDD